MHKKILLCLAGLVLFLVVWELVVHFFPFLKFVLPAPSAVGKILFELRDRFWIHTRITLFEMCCGFLLALIGSFPLAWVMVHFQATRSFLQPLFIVIQCIPMFTLAPIMVIWFGWSYLAIIIPTALMIFFPLTLNIYQGLRSTPQELLDFFQASQATPLQTFVKLRLPWALSHIFAGFRIASAIAGVCAIAGEWAGAQEGLGILMLESRRNTELEITFGALTCLTAISSLFYLIILICEKFILCPCQRKFFLRKLPAICGPWLKKRLALTFLMIICLSLLLYGCSMKGTNKPIRLLLDWLPNPNHIPLYVGLEQGFFQEEGIDLAIQKMQDSCGGIAYLISRKADLLVFHMPGTLKACEKGAKLKIVGLLIKEPLCGLTYNAELEIHQPKDLSGKTFGYCIGSPDFALLDFLLKQGNIEPKEKKNVSVDLVSAMGTKSVDFIYGGFWNIEPAQLRSIGVETKTIKIQELGVPTYYEMLILACADSNYSHSNFVKRFQTALQKSIDYCKHHPEEAFSIFLAFNKDHTKKTITWQKEAWEMTCPLLADNQTIDNELVKNFYTWQLGQGITQIPFDYQNLLISLP
jgi:NitT/TauT family transport system substrate-binding protein